MDQDFKSFERSCIAMGLRLTADELAQKYQEYQASIEATKKNQPEKWVAAERQAMQQKVNDEVYNQTMSPTWKK